MYISGISWEFPIASHCQVWLPDGIWIISTWFHMFGSIVYTGMCPQSLNVQGIIPMTKPKRRNSRRLRPLGDQRSKCFKGSFPVTRISLRTVPFALVMIQVHLTWKNCAWDSGFPSSWVFVLSDFTMATAKKQWDQKKTTPKSNSRLKTEVERSGSNMFKCTAVAPHTSPVNQTQETPAPGPHYEARSQHRHGAVAHRSHHRTQLLQ